ncbi:MAG TPA: DUF523 domain-containing protein [Acidimicrobiales bacterium]|nr:DUF523 domain-containing protein [Acidimicrobiales bacterium]
MAERSGEGSGERGCSRPLLVSACLLGVRCNHEGGANTSEAVVALGARFRLVPVCPETAGGLPTPRPRAELSVADGRVRTASGADVTSSYARGAAHAVRLAGSLGAAAAVLKARSPSCGCHEIYDGTFTRTRVPGEGVTASALRAAGVQVLSEDDIASGDLPPSE